MHILFATHNKNKVMEINSMMTNGLKLLSLSDVGMHTEIPETGKTIKENSFLKAKAANEFLKTQNKQMSVFADDSGLEVIALSAAPGVNSARYAGEERDDEKNNRKLLLELKNITKRNARFVTIITLLINEEIFFFEGEIKGTIAYEARGKNGFGYDPLFIPQGYRSTFGELGPEIKNKISHRAQAFDLLKDFLVKQNLK